MEPQYTLKNFIPLFSLFGIVTIFASLGTWIGQGGSHLFMRLFMAGFFLAFGFLKTLKLGDFQEAYKKYDLIAKMIPSYGYVYPFIEIALGLAYLFNLFSLPTNLANLFFMGIGAVGVIRILWRGERLLCVCMGTVFKLPMTWVTLGENLLMVLMAIHMLTM